jgi:hypothetical protein
LLWQIGDIQNKLILVWQIAQYLSERGFVVLRYDKRDIGANGTIINNNVWGNVTSNDLIHDALHLAKNKIPPISYSLNHI